jgi:ribosomal protein S15P/S13E
MTNNHYQKQLIARFNQTNYDPMTYEIDVKILSARIARNVAKHKIQDLMMKRKKYDHTL